MDLRLLSQGGCLQDLTPRKRESAQLSYILMKRHYQQPPCSPWLLFSDVLWKSEGGRTHRSQRYFWTTWKEWERKDPCTGNVGVWEFNLPSFLTAITGLGDWRRSVPPPVSTWQGPTGQGEFSWVAISIPLRRPKGFPLFLAPDPRRRNPEGSIAGCCSHEASMTSHWEVCGPWIFLTKHGHSSIILST